MNGTPSFFTLSKRAFWFWFGGLWLVVGLGALVVGAVGLIRERRWQSEGRVVRGSVLEKELRTASESDDGTVFHVSYRFATREGRTVGGEGELSAAAWKPLEEGSPIQIEYLSGDPTVNRLEGTGDVAGFLVTLAVGAFFSASGGFLFLKGLRSVRTWRRLLREGVAAEGTVSAVVESNVQFNKRPLWVVQYHYRDHSGQTREGKSGYMSGEEVAEWKAGDTGRIRFDSRNPQESIWIGRG